MEAKVFVATYWKYNNGQGGIGKWIDLVDFHSKELFLKKAKEIHHDEADPEFMFSDKAGLCALMHPDWLSESTISENVFHFLNEWDDNEYNAEKAEVFLKWLDCPQQTPFKDLLEKFEDCLCGKHESEEEFALEMETEMFSLLESNIKNEMSDSLVKKVSLDILEKAQMYFSTQDYAISLSSEHGGDYTFIDGWVFQKR